jgi:hypothetical protein
MGIISYNSPTNHEQIQATQLVFFMAMALYPSVQKRIQDEIDRVVGTDRLPSYEDRPSLPIVEAVVRETLRWRPVAPLAVPHTTVKDDVYKGYYIPKGKLTSSRPTYHYYSYYLFFRHDGYGEHVVGFQAFCGSSGSFPTRSQGNQPG